MVTTYDLSVFESGRKPASTDASASQNVPTTNNSAKSNMYSLLEAASEEVKKAQQEVKRVRAEMKELVAKLEGQDIESNFQYKMLKDELEEAMQTYTYAQNKETMLLKANMQ